MVDRILITGATGFAGHFLVDHLLSQGKNVIGTTHGEIPPHFPNGLIPLIPCDIRNPLEAQKVLSEIKPTQIFHLAAQASVASSWEEPGETFRINTLGTINILDSCRTLRLNPKILLISSATVYGLPSNGEKFVEDIFLDPVDPYGISKAMADRIAILYQKTYGLQILRARAFNHIGPGPSDKHAIGNFARQIAEIKPNDKGKIYVGNLSAKRNFTDVRDIVRAYTLLIEQGQTGEAYNVCGDTVLSIENVLDQMIALSRRNIEKIQSANRMRPVDTPVLDGDNSKLKQVTGWEPEISLEKSLNDLLDYWRTVSRNFSGEQA